MDSMKQAFMRELGLTVQPQATAGVFGSGAMQQGQLPRDPVSAFQAIETMLKSTRTNSQGQQMHAVAIIDYAESLMPNGTWGQLSSEDRHCVIKVLGWAKDPDISKSANSVILVADSAALINESIISSSSRIEQLQILLPQPEERAAFIEHMDRTVQEKQKKEGKRPTGLAYAKGFDEIQFAHLTAGLKKINMEDIRLTAGKRGLTISADIVKARKRNK